MRGDRLTRLRQEKRLSQRELGEIVSVSGYTISSYVVCIHCRRRVHTSYRASHKFIIWPCLQGYKG